MPGEVFSRPELRPEFFRLPKPGQADPYFGFTRTFFFTAEKRGWIKLIRLCDEGKRRGITLVPYSEMMQLVRSRAEAQK
jgi:hypothetical protein